MNLMFIVTHTTAFKMIFKIFFINISKGDVLHTHTQKKKKCKKVKSMDSVCYVVFCFMLTFSLKS